MKTNVRVPRQERSIEKKNKIIEASYELFSEVGYYGTNTAEIAKHAGVSTGIVYGYFQDKRDILICILEKYINSVVEPLYKLLDKFNSPIDFSVFIPSVLDTTIKMHKKNAKIHEALHSLTHTDEAVNFEFMALENKITERICTKLKSLNVKIENDTERVHFAMNIVQSFCHEYVFDKHDYIDYDAMREMVINSLIKLFQ